MIENFCKLVFLAFLEVLCGGMEMAANLPLGLTDSFTKREPSDWQSTEKTKK